MSKFLALFAACALMAAAETSLERYVKAPDPSYKWELVSTINGKGLKAYVLDLTSQTWRTEKEVNRTLWKHWLTVYVPDEVKHTTGFLFITGGGNGGKPPATMDIMMMNVALETQSVVAELKQVPNQPLAFTDDQRNRSEDGIIAYTWDKFLRTGDDSWPLRLPMTKAAVRALDTVTAFCGSGKMGRSLKVDRFVVSGGSKRGWTTWTTAITDRRVVAIVPIVIDLLNMVPSFEHHYRVYGFWAPAIKDYEQAGIMDWSRTKEYKNLLKIEEPYEYRDKLTLPKFIVNSAGDQFFLPDSSQFYWDGLKGEKYLRYVPNTDHGMGNSDTVQSLIAYYSAILNQRARPTYNWKVQKNGDIVVTSKDQPSEVKLWVARNEKARDFRLVSIGKAYQATPLTPTKKGQWIAKAPQVDQGYAAYFVELTYPSGSKYPFKFTTQVKVWPDTYPHPPFQPKQQVGTPTR